MYLLLWYVTFKDSELELVCATEKHSFKKKSKFPKFEYIRFTAIIFFKTYNKMAMVGQ